MLRASCRSSRLLSLVPRALLFDPTCARLTLSRLLPSQGPSLRFLLLLSSHLPTPDQAPAASPQLPGVDAFLLRLPPPLAADAAALLASHLGLHPSLPTLNAASRAALRAARPDLVFRLFSSFSSSPAFPGDAATVACLVRACAADRRPLDGLRLLRDAARRGSPPSLDAAADLVAAFAAMGNFAKVSETLHLIISAGCTPDTLVYNPIIRGLFARGIGDEALRVFNEIKLRGYAIDGFTYNTVINGLCKMGRIADARKMWDEMVCKGNEPNEHTYCSFLHYYCQAGDFGMAYKVYDEMLGKGFKENTVSCTIIIRGFCVHGMLEEAVRVFEGMVTKGIKHSVITYNTLIHGLCKAGRLAEAIGMYQRLLSSDLEPDVSTFTTLIDSMCEEGQVDDAVELLRLMQTMGLEPLVHSHDSVINGFCKVRRADDSMAWLAGMLKDNLKPQEHTFNSLLELLSNSERMDDALLILSTMFKTGYGLGSLACTTLVDKLCTGSVSYSHKLEDIAVSS
jgi:pentatricopeptide repeat protein